MSEIKDGGPAFPYCIWVGDHHQGHCAGMTLRDWFAGMALQGLITGCYAGPNAGLTVGGNVTAAFEYADAMIRAREKKP